ncbi:MAG: META domain-containing protein [Candidatus Eremiobacteraeota bacterium]|nr:META domain-containing protein [Candidatus Eremiobacteraeota bacterium]
MRIAIASAFFLIGWVAVASGALAPPFPIPATFSGIQPCADCPGIRSTVQLNKDGSASLVLHYLERSVPNVVYTGTWSYDKAKSQIALHSKMGAPQLFTVVNATTLRALDRSGSQPAARAPHDLKLLALDSNEWTLVALHGTAVIRGVTSQPPSLSFDAAARRVSGFTGCNRFNGTYKQGGADLRLSPLVVTRMACASGADIEASLLKALAQTQKYDFNNGLLNLYGLGQPLASFAPAGQ